MLSFTVKDGELVTIGNVTMVARYKPGKRMLLSFEAPREVRISRMQIGRNGTAAPVETMMLKPSAEAAELPRGGRSWGITGEMRQHALNSADD